MKWKSKYNKAGTKCKVRRDYRDADTPTKLRVGDVVRIEGRSVLKPMVVCENEKGDLVHIPSQLLKRIKPERHAFKVGDWFIDRAGYRRQVAEIVDDDPCSLRVHDPNYKDHRFNPRFCTPCDPPPTVPDGCPVDEQCHREMTEAGWEWIGPHYGQSTSQGFAIVNPRLSGLQIEAYGIFAAWRERSKA